MLPTPSIAVTGIGSVSALGLDINSAWEACRNAKNGIRSTILDPGPNGPAEFEALTARLPDDTTQKLEIILGHKLGGSLDSASVFAVYAAQEALKDAKLTEDERAKAGIIMGCAMGGVHTLEASYERFYGRKADKLHPFTIPKIMPSAPTSAIAMEFGIKGPVFTISSACASSGHAIVQAAMMIAAGIADVVICGGAESIISPGCMAAWAAMRATSKTACRPFSKGRDGMVVGEGAAVLILESGRHALNRGAHIYSWLTGFGMTSDASNWTRPDLNGAVNCIRTACETAGVMDKETILISTHGTGTVLNDINEAKALNKVFGKQVQNHPVIATKSAHGHLIGATTALQSTLGIKAIESGFAPQIQNYLGGDPEIDLDLVVEQGRSIEAEHLLVNAFAFGGLNVSLVFENFKAEN